MSDEGFHEIQLNGKQLVFLFMAATVVSVVIFLCGVMVGRGVRDRTVSVAAGEQPVASASTDTTQTDTPPARTVPEANATTGSAAVPAPQQASTSPPLDQVPPPPAEGADEDDYNSLVKGQKDSGVGTMKGRSAPAPARTPDRLTPKTASKTPEPPARKSGSNAPPAVPPAKVAETAPPSSSSGYAVQLAAVRERSEADAIVKRLVSKGYQAYVLVPQPGKAPVYRVQVGRFKNRSEASKIAARLQKDEQFKPWVTR
jgi:cell division septation protein DedD